MTDIGYFTKAGLAIGTACVVVNCTNAIGLKCVIWGSRMISKIPSPGIIAAGVTGITAGLAAEGSAWIFFREEGASNIISNKLQDMGCKEKMAKLLLITATFVVPFFITTFIAPSLALRLGQQLSYKAAACYTVIDLSIYTGIRLMPMCLLGSIRKAITYVEGRISKE